MKEFEKWWVTSGIQEKTAPYVDDQGLAYWAWRAALEWVLRHREYKQPLNGPYFSWYTKIQRELED